MTTKTITDQAGDTVRISTGTLTAPTGHVTVKVNEHYLGREYSAAAHADPAALRAALDEVAPLGKYTRTTPDPDDMDGGVAAALIEKEAEENDAAEARPLTPDAITDEARDRAYRAVAALSVSDWDDMSGAAKGRAMALVEAVITEITRPEPTARPEGAEEIDEHLRQANAAALGGALTLEQRRALADHLAGLGYRSPIGLAEDGAA